MDWRRVYSDEDIQVQTGVMRKAGDSVQVSADDMNFSKMIETDESGQTIFISDPENQTELRRFLEGSLDGWRVFLHPEQRKIAYRDYNGPAMVRGGPEPARQWLRCTGQNILQIRSHRVKTV